MPEIDRFALHTLQSLTSRLLKAYEAYEFHVIYHRLYNYCTLDLSAFYLDILKDRLYVSPPASTARRSAQTVMAAILDAMVRLMAPILAFTAEEIWKYMPRGNAPEESVHMARMPETNESWRDEALAERWQRILKIRGEVTRALEKARADKRIGHSLDAAVTLSVNPQWYDYLSPYADHLRSIFIASKASLVKDQALEDAFRSDEIEGLAIGITRADGQKCERCWVYEPTVGDFDDHPTVCDRCKNALDEILTEE
jgi:isoleucyl-tRNA synthetase